MFQIHPSLLALATPTESLVPDERNARRHSKRSIAEIATSYREHGQLKPIVVTRSDRVVRAGNGQLAAAKSLGWTEIAVLFVDDEPNQATRYALRDNRTAELSDWDFDGLASLLRELDGSEGGSVDLGWTTDEITPFLEAIFDPAAAAASHDLGGLSEFGASSRRSAIFNAQQWKVLEPYLDATILAKSGLGSAIVEAMCRGRAKT